MSRTKDALAAEEAAVDAALRRDSERVCAEIAHFTNPDRESCAVPFPLRLDAANGNHATGPWYWCATDGHRAVYVRHAGAALAAPQANEALDNLIADLVPRDAPELGELDVEDLAAARELPRKWHNVLTLAAHGYPPRLRSTHKRVAGRKEREIVILDVSVGFWGPSLSRLATPVAIGVNLGYLLDAVDFIGYRNVTIRKDTKDEWSPLLLHVTGAAPAACNRLAIIMPMRL